MHNAKLARQVFQRGMVAQALRQRAETVLDTLGQELVYQVEAETPVDTGYLKGHWIAERDGLKLTLYNDAEYADEVEYGRSGGMLRRNTIPDVVRARAVELWKKK